MNDNIKNLLIIWAIVMLLNQVLLFSACFKVHCLINAIPHTFIIAFVINMIIQNNKDK